VASNATHEQVPESWMQNVYSKPIGAGASGPQLHRIFIDSLQEGVPKSLVAKYFKVKDLPPRDLLERIVSSVVGPDDLCRKEGELLHFGGW
jgi:hypothetical protein